MGGLDFDDDEASIDEDENSDGGEVSMAGSDRGMDQRGYGGYGQGGGAGGAGGGYMGGDAMDDDNIIQDDDEENDF